jgi:hypothetical protein
MKETYYNKVGFASGTASDYTCVVVAIRGEDFIHKLFNLVVKNVCVRIVVEIAPIEFVLAMFAVGHTSATQSQNKSD